MELVDFTMWLTGEKQDAAIQIITDYMKQKAKDPIKGIQISQILDVVATVEGVTVDAVKSDSRYAPLPWCRKAFLFMSQVLEAQHENESARFQDMSAMINRDHAMCIYSFKTVLSDLRYSEFSEKINIYRELLGVPQAQFDFMVKRAVNRREK